MLLAKSQFRNSKDCFSEEGFMNDRSFLLLSATALLCTSLYLAVLLTIGMQRGCGSPRQPLPRPAMQPIAEKRT